MRFLADECCDSGLVRALREYGYDVTYVPETKAGASDDEVLLDAYNEGRILLTEDKDFGELVYRLKKPSIGIILMRINVKERHTKVQRLKEFFDKYQDRLEGYFVVIDSQKTRLRPLLYSL